MGRRLRPRWAQAWSHLYPWHKLAWASALLSSGRLWKRQALQTATALPWYKSCVKISCTTNQPEKPPWLLQNLKIWDWLQRRHCVRIGATSGTALIYTSQQASLSVRNSTLSCLPEIMSHFERPFVQSLFHSKYSENTTHKYSFHTLNKNSSISPEYRKQNRNSFCCCVDCAEAAWFGLVSVRQLTFYITNFTRQDVAMA